MMDGLQEILVFLGGLALYAWRALRCLAGGC
jgi:hypothetical protein